MKNMSRVDEIKFFQERLDCQVSLAEKERRVRLRKPTVVFVQTTRDGGSLVINRHGDDGQPEHFWFEHLDADHEPIEIRDGFFDQCECMESMFRYFVDFIGGTNYYEGNWRPK